MSGGAALGAALITWLKDTKETVEVAGKVVGAVWPQLCRGQLQRHPTVMTSCKTKMELTGHVERWVRVNRERCSQHLTILGCPRCQHRVCIECNEAKGLTECPMCSEASPRMKTEQCFLIQGESPRVRCLNVHALGEQWIEKVTAARVSGRAQNEGEHLEFRAHITGWEMEAKKSRCDKVLTKSDCNLRRELLEKKDVLLILHDSCPEHTPLDETPGWWYVPTEEILGRVCKKCNALRVLSEFTSRERDRKNKASCRKCKPEGSHGGGRSGLKRARTSF
jgi:hypothetical protein